MEINIKDKNGIQIVSDNLRYANPTGSVRYLCRGSGINEDSKVAFYLAGNNTHLASARLGSIRVNGIAMTPDNMDELLSALFLQKETQPGMDELIESLNREMEKMEVANKNYVLNSKSVTKQAEAGNNHARTFLTLSKSIEQNTDYTLSIGSTVINSGTQVAEFSVYLYDLDGKNIRGMHVFPVSDKRESITFSTGKMSAQNVTLALYTGKAGAAAARSMTWNEILLEQGSAPSRYRPAPEDVKDRWLSLTEDIRSLDDKSNV